MENVDPGEVESFMDCEGQSSIEVGDYFQWARIDREKRTTDSRDSPESVDTSMKSSESSSLTYIKSEEKHKNENLDPGGNTQGISFSSPQAGPQ